MHIHKAYTKLIAWLETPSGLAGLAHYARMRRNLDEVRGKDKAAQILRDLRDDKLYMRDLRLLAAFCADTITALAIFMNGLGHAVGMLEVLVQAAGGWGEVMTLSKPWTPEERARFKARNYSNPARATA